MFELDSPKIIVFSFVAIILIGTVLLALPIASRDGNSAGLFTALFTSTSATCVTGMLVVDTYQQWSLFGQLVILLLFQIGALGFVTFATFFSVLIKRKVSLKEMVLAQESLNHFSFEDVLKLVKNVVLFTFSVELAGALILSIRFIPMFGLKGIYMSIFHSVSAFCNSGFDIMGQRESFSSLTTFNQDPIILNTLSSLIIFGGLGFIVWKDLVDYKKNKFFLLHTKVVLIATAILLLLGALLFFAFEFNNPATLGPLSLPSKINAAFFHSTTSRSAGFNNVPINQIRETSKLITIILMFIGAAPGSTGGGVKITTFAVMIATIISQAKGSSDTIILKKRISQKIVYRSLSIIGLCAMLVVSITIAILFFEDKPLIDVLFEVTSAFSTVGMTTIGTFNMSVPSQFLLLITMFLGRVGPLSFAIALATKNYKKDLVYPEGKIMVG
ncbi:TrkH family potassium uptake protein [Acetivibrio straminisolvens]|jgi:trk system potassium uptake protein TrkH|nr:potassium transporter TrkG [Acetivibrio straminisolvens]